MPYSRSGRAPLHVSSLTARRSQLAISCGLVGSTFYPTNENLIALGGVISRIKHAENGLDATRTDALLSQQETGKITASIIPIMSGCHPALEH